MSGSMELDGIELIPVFDLYPEHFASEGRVRPDDLALNNPDGWYRHWADCLADSGIVVEPLWRGGLSVPVSEFAADDLLLRFLEATFRQWGGIEELVDPDSQPALEGGIAFRCESIGVLVEPGCCADLGNIAGWREAAGSKDPEWRMLWNGHPWLSHRYRELWLILSEPYESDEPAGRWAVRPGELGETVGFAEAEIARLHPRICNLLREMGFRGDAREFAARLLGLPG